MRQLIIARKDLKMSPGKLAAQCCHASMAFLTKEMPKATGIVQGNTSGYVATILLDSQTYEDWFFGHCTKTICEARNRNQLLKAVEIAKSLGLEENKDFFLIMDGCFTELLPEEFDENGVGKTLTCIGFRPLQDEIAHAISRKYQLYR